MLGIDISQKLFTNCIYHDNGHTKLRVAVIYFYANCSIINTVGARWLRVFVVGGGGLSLYVQ